MEIKNDDYRVTYDPAIYVITFEGVMRLHGNDYDDLVKLLQEIVVARPEQVTLDLRKLEFLNSSGLNHLFKFSIKLRNQSPARLIIKGNDEILWQQKSLKNMTHLNNKAELMWN